MKIGKEIITQDTKDKILRTKLEPINLPLTKEEVEKTEIMKKIIDATFEGRNEELGLPPGVGIAANQIG